MNNCVFKRYELKFFLTPGQYAAFMNAVGNRLCEDKHGESTVQSLYYDTDDYRLIRRSTEKPVFKEKLRVRSYGLAGDNDAVFIELKRKYKGVVYKRRLETKPSFVNEYLYGGITDGGQISREIAYFARFYGRLSPKMLLLYDRTAYFGEGDLRVTFDRNIRYRTQRLTLSGGLDGIPLVPYGKILMEIKTGTAIPLWLAKILSAEKIVKTSFSKYGEAYKEQLLNRNTEVKKVG